MPRGSPPTERVVGILRLLASSNEPLTLSAIANTLGLNLSTCQTVLNTLADANLVIRSRQTKAYTLGPSLILLGNAARALTPLLARAGAIVDGLHAETGYGCTLMMAARDELVVVHRAGSPDRFPVRAMAEGPFPFAAPFGATIVAFAPPAQQEAWLGRPAGADDPLNHRALLETIRDRGWCGWSYGPQTQEMQPQFDRILHHLARNTHSASTVEKVIQLVALSGSHGVLADEFDRAKVLSLTMITVPAHLPTVDLEIDVYLYERSIARAPVQRVARAAVAAAEAISKLDG
ncbi:MAG TPA: helix-turn-helix domain-containing protein [Acidimicrobiales bacterium]